MKKWGKKMRFNGTLIGRGLHPDSSSHPKDFPRESFLFLPIPHMLNHTVGKSDGKTLIPIGKMTPVSLNPAYGTFHGRNRYWKGRIAVKAHNLKAGKLEALPKAW